jgi:hypothetical protein
MGKRFKKNPDGSDSRPKGNGKGKKTGFGLLGILAFAGSLLGMVGWVAHRERSEKRQLDGNLLRRLRSKPLGFSKHAACRMDCRFITRDDAVATLETGVVSPRHSSPNARQGLTLVHFSAQRKHILLDTLGA